MPKVILCARQSLSKSQHRRHRRSENDPPLSAIWPGSPPRGLGRPFAHETIHTEGPWRIIKARSWSYLPPVVIFWREMPTFPKQISQKMMFHGGSKGLGWTENCPRQKFFGREKRSSSKSCQFVKGFVPFCGQATVLISQPVVPGGMKRFTDWPPLVVGAFQISTRGKKSAYCKFWIVKFVRVTWCGWSRAPGHP